VHYLQPGEFSLSAKDYVVKDDMHAFVVRIWRETPGPDQDAWRGSVEHVGYHKRLYFRSLDVVTTFIQQQAGAGFAAAAPQRHSLTAWIRRTIEKVRRG
jgi:hypothetical protein